MFAPAFRLWRLCVGWAIPWFLMFIAPHSVLLLLACAMGGMKWASGIALMLAMDAAIAAVCGRLSFECRCAMFNQRLLIKLLRGIRAFNPDQKNLVFREKGWEYSDDDAFLRFGREAVCWLIASEIDFTRPVLSASTRIYDDIVRRKVNADYIEIHTYDFCTLSGKTLRVRADRLSPLYAWVRAHGGTVKSIANHPSSIAEKG